MVHLLASLGFVLIAAAAGGLIWFTLADNRAAILGALGFAPSLPAIRPVERRIRVRSVRPVSFARAVQTRRAA